MYSAKELFTKHQQHQLPHNEEGIRGYTCEHYHHDMVIAVLISILEELESLNYREDIVIGDKI